jgi:hypothetical protein
VAETKIKVTADTSQAEREIKNLEKALEGLQAVSSGAAIALGAITAAAAAMGVAVLRTLDSAGQLIDTARVLGITAQSLQALQHAATLSGVSIEAFDQALIKMSGNLGAAFAKGSGPAIDALNKLNIPLQEIGRLRPDAQFQRIAEELNKMTNPAERNAMAIELFGKQGPRMLEVANNTQKAREEMERMGLALSDFDVAALDQAGDSVDQLKNIFDAGLKKAVADIAPYIVAMVNKIKDAIEAAGGFEAVWQKIKNAIRLALNIALLTAAIGALAKMVSIGIQLATAIRTAGSAMALFNTIVMRNPLMLVVGAAVALATLLGVDVVGAIEKAMGLTEGLGEANVQINEQVVKNQEAQGEMNDLVLQESEERKKALQSLEDAISKIQASSQYQRELVNLGEQEANIRKAVREEEIRIQALKKNITAEEMAAHTARFEAEKRIESSLIRQNQLRQEQSAAILTSIQSAYTPFQQALQKQVDFRLVLEGKGAQEIQRIRTEEVLKSKRLLEIAENNLKDNINKTINDEIGKYDKLYAMKVRHNQEERFLFNLEQDAIANNHKLTLEQQTALLAAQKALFTQQQTERIELERQTQEALYKLEEDRIKKVLTANRTGEAENLHANDRAILQQRGAQERQAQIVNDRIAFEKKSEEEKAQFVIQQGADMFSALGAHNKKAFEAAKAFNIANAIMNTYMGATKALATYPPPFNFIAAAAVIGMGLAQVATIRNQQYSGRQLGGPVMGGTPYLVGENGPELFTPNTTGSITRNSDLGGGGPVNVTFTINAIDTSDFDTLITQRQGTIKQIISDAMLERGQRSVV